MFRFTDGHHGNDVSCQVLSSLTCKLEHPLHRQVYQLTPTGPARLCIDHRTVHRAEGSKSSSSSFEFEFKLTRL